jgi:ABC-type sulfate transport system substrate-binding protein
MDQKRVECSWPLIGTRGPNKVPHVLGDTTRRTETVDRARVARFAQFMSYLKPVPAPQISSNPFGNARAARYFLAVFVVFFSAKVMAQDALLNASYDVSRELYREINASFAADWKARTGRSVEIRRAHAGSSVQARAVIDGLEADVVTFNQVIDLDALVEAKLVSKDWQTKYPDHASPYHSVMAFIVRHGNSKGIKNWDDLVKPGMQIALANPKTSGNGRYAYLSAYGYALYRR